MKACVSVGIVFTVPIILGSWAYWIGGANYVILASIPALIISFLGLAAALGEDSRLRSPARDLIRALSISLLLAMILANGIGYQLRELGLRPRMKWGQRVAACLDQYLHEFGRYPDSLEDLKSWKNSENVSLSGGGVYEYIHASQGSYELWLHMGLIEAYVLKGKDQPWEQYVCW